jgi:hypothetical protein
MALQKHDKLNNLSIPYDKYFGEMGLSKEEIVRRINLAKRIEKVFGYVFILIKSDLLANNYFDAEYYADLAKRRYADILIEFDIDIKEAYPWLLSHIDESVDYIIENISEYAEQVSEDSEDVEDEVESWYLSDDRARLIAENEANSVGEYKAFQDAVNKGKTRKVWNTMLDYKVRHTHTELEGYSIPIMERFKVGNYEMYQPKDTSLGAGMEEIANCRCWCTYT